MALRILVVCLGNICRSPLAEGILAHQLDTLATVESAGTAGYHIGSPPDHRSVAVAKEKGLDISSQRARQFRSSDFKIYDHILVMDRQNYADVIEMAPDTQSAEKVALILSALEKEDLLEVPDPYYGNNNDFLHVFELLHQAAVAWKEKLTGLS